jgi:1-hydroxycarotenoid 3,4-desaturase
VKRGRVAVVGGGLGGLAAAGRLARAGHQVTLYELEATLGGKAQQLHAGRTVLDAGPTLLTLPRLVEETFAALGASELLPRVHELPAHCTYRWADGRRFTAHRAPEATAASVAQLSAEDAPRVAGFYREAADIFEAAGAPYLEAPFTGYAGFMARVLRRGVGAVARGLQLSTLDALARRHFHSPELQQFVGRFATYAGASPYRASAAFALLAHLEVAEGVHHVQGGLGALVGALDTAIRRLGVEVRLSTRAGFRRGRRGLTAGPAGEEAEVDAVVVNADPLASLGRAGEPLAMSGYVLLLETAVRAPLPHHSVCFSEDYRREFADIFSGRVPDAPTLYVCHPAATDATMAAPGTSGLSLLANVPATAGAEDWSAHAARLRGLCCALLERTWPELRGKLRVLGERTPADFLRQGAPGGSLYGFLPHGRLGPFRRPKLRGGPGVVFAGGGTHPGGGVPMVLLSARFAAQLLLARELRA